MAYKSRAKFNFNVYDYPDYFNLDLLKKHGWYHPNKNPNGISRDHLMSIQEGWIFKVNPDIISHPANCQLVFHYQNNSKNTKSIITLDELLKKMEKLEKRGRIELLE